MTETASSGAEAWTIQRILGWATEDFRVRGFDSPRLDAELLLARVLQVDRVRLITDAFRPLGPEELAAFKALFVRRRASEPMAYILGEREFYGRRFVVDKRVLVPRPDTETLITVALRRTKARSEFGTALDLCTGSGCVGITFAKERLTWKVTATDISIDALEVARENSERLGSTWNTSFVQSDLFSKLGTARWDLILSNPPYIPNAEISALQRDIYDYEPRLALEGGLDGLDLVRRLVEKAPHHLCPEGSLALEIGHDQADRVVELMARNGFVDIAKAEDYGRHERVVSGRLPP